MLETTQLPVYFKFLSTAFAYPDATFLTVLHSNTTLLPASHVAHQLIAAFEKEDQELLQGEYTRLFINGYPHTPCAPYESLYREGRMIGEAAVEVQALYRQWGMSVETALSDHIATEYEFLSFLASARLLDNLASTAKAAFHHFVNDHVLQWMPQFAQDLQHATHNKAYQLLGNMVEQSVALLQQKS